MPIFETSIGLTIRYSDAISLINNPNQIYTFPIEENFKYSQFIIGVSFHSDKAGAFQFLFTNGSRTNIDD